MLENLAKELLAESIRKKFHLILYMFQYSLEQNFNFVNLFIKIS